MIEGFVTTYKDEDDYVHLYFYHGIDDKHNIIYNDIDLTDCGVEYKERKLSDGASDYMFLNKNIVKISCTLVKQNGEIDFQELKI